MNTSQPIYTFDTNFILEFKFHYYFSTFQSLRTKIEDLAKSGQIVISRYVIEELEKKDDEIYLWAKKTFLVIEDIDEDQVSILPEIVTEHKDWYTAEKTPADPFIIALAETKGYIIITKEKKIAHNKGANNRIPAVCTKRGVKCADPEEFFKELKWVF